MNCISCKGPTKDECLSCNIATSDYGNGTCLETCEWPFRRIYSHPAYLCVEPCKPDEYIWNLNESCIADCAPPLVSSTNSNGMLVCENHCPNPQDFLYMNKSYLSDCPAPLEAELHVGVKFYKNPCKGYFYAQEKSSNFVKVHVSLRVYSWRKKGTVFQIVQHHLCQIFWRASDTATIHAIQSQTIFMPIDHVSKNAQQHYKAELES